MELEEVTLDQLKPHPRNYRNHPDDEIEHLMQSIQANGIYRNIAVAQDGTILAGHGVVEASRRLGLPSVPVYRTEYKPNDPRALKLLVSDNTVSHLAMDDDRVLTELLKEVMETDTSGLFGTGYDEMMLANLLMVTRPASEIEDLDAATQWAGMPEYDVQDDSYGRIQVTVNFANEEDRLRFCHLLSIDTEKIASGAKSVWWPKPQEKDDVRSIHFADVDRGKA